VLSEITHAIIPNFKTLTLILHVIGHLIVTYYFDDIKLHI